MIGAQPMLTYTVLYTYILCLICNVTLVSQMRLWSIVRMLDCISRNPGFESRQVKKIHFAKLNFKT